jgi:hypothetical protein
VIVYKLKGRNRHKTRLKKVIELVKRKRERERERENWTYMLIKVTWLASHILRHVILQNLTICFIYAKEFYPVLIRGTKWCLWKVPLQSKYFGSGDPPLYRDLLWLPVHHILPSCWFRTGIRVQLQFYIGYLKLPNTSFINFFRITHCCSCLPGNSAIF